MDIHGWLRDAGDYLQQPAPQDSSYHAKTSEAPEKAVCQMQGESLSSFVAPLIARSYQSRELSRRRSGMTSASVLSPCTSPSTTSSTASASHPGSDGNRYKKRGRHATRPEKYAPVKKKKKKKKNRDRHNQDGEKLKSPKTQARKSGGEKNKKNEKKKEKQQTRHQTGLVQMLQTKNVTKNRLTVSLYEPYMPYIPDHPQARSFQDGSVYSRPSLETSGEPRLYAEYSFVYFNHSANRPSA